MEVQAEMDSNAGAQGEAPSQRGRNDAPPKEPLSRRMNLRQCVSFTERPCLEFGRDCDDGSALAGLGCLHRCQFWCQLVLEFDALSCGVVLFDNAQSIDSVRPCTSVRFDARGWVGLRVSCSRPLLLSIETESFEPSRKWRWTGLFTCLQ